MTTKKETEQLNNYKGATMMLIVISTIFMVGFFLILDQRDNLREELKELKYSESVKWECPLLLETGEYNFNSEGILISPSGKELRCKKVGEEYHEGTFLIQPHSRIDVYEGGLITCKELVEITWEDDGGRRWDALFNVGNETIYCRYKMEREP